MDSALATSGRHSGLMMRINRSREPAACASMCAGCTPHVAQAKGAYVAHRRDSCSFTCTANWQHEPHVSMLVCTSLMSMVQPRDAYIDMNTKDLVSTQMRHPSHVLISYTYRRHAPHTPSITHADVESRRHSPSTYLRQLEHPAQRPQHQQLLPATQACMAKHCKAKRQH